jgi:hypothetical protein
MRKSSLLAYLLVCLINCSFAGDINICGFIHDSVSGEALLYSTVIDLNSNKGVLANEYGFYSINTNSGHINLKFSFVGYAEKSLIFFTTKDTVINIRLSSLNKLEEVVVRSHKNEIVNSTQLSVSGIDLKKTALLPKSIIE